MEMMEKPKRSRFFQRPGTKTGWWAAGLTILSIVMLTINNLGLNPFEKLMDVNPIPLRIYDFIMMGSLLGGIILGIIALTSKRERSWMIWLFMIPLLFFGIFLIVALFERLTYDTRVEVAPTPDLSIERVPVIFDDDGSPDGTSALLYLLSNPDVDLQIVSVSYGEAHPRVFIQHLGRVLEQYGYGDVPLGAGQDAPLSGNNAFPDFVREGSNGFWGFGPEEPEQKYVAQDSAKLMVQLINQTDEPITILATGALTNLAQALRLDPDITENIAAVYIMGGAVNVPGNLNDLVPDTENTFAEWNIYADPLAASEVFNSGLNLYLLPLDATNSIQVNANDIAQWRKGGNIPDFAADIYDSLMEAWGVDEVEMWDLVTAEIMMNPEHCTFTPLRLEVVIEEGQAEGQTRVVEGKANVNVCLEPDSEAIKETLSQVFSSRK